MNTENIPAILKAKRQWVCYRAYTEGDKVKKQIISPVTGEFAKCNDPLTWTSFDDALVYCNEKGLTGLVFALTEGITFLDLDHSVEKNTGKISEFAKNVIAMFPNTYMELSVSKTGIHILAYGSLPDGVSKRNDKLGLEMYDKNRFLCITGDSIGSVKDLADYTENIRLVNDMYIGKRPDLPQMGNITTSSNKTDTELINLIKGSRQASKFSRLYSGDLSNYPSHSNADYALTNILTFWTQDAMQIDRILRSSGLYREKWDRRLGNSTYGQITIDNALRNVRVKYRDDGMEL